MSNSRINSLKLRIAALEAELTTCQTAAEDASVRATLDDVWRQLEQEEWAEDISSPEELERAGLLSAPLPYDSTESEISKYV